MEVALLAAAVHDACVQEVRAFKPGNVSVCAPGHGMDASHFLRSAAAAAGPLTRPGAAVGARIEAAIDATWRVVSCNTNLGIVLLMAPLLRAAESLPAPASPAQLRRALAQELARLDVEDARACYRAIRRAGPGGLGRSDRHDIAQEPSVSLLVAMREAAARDSIAREYATGFELVLDVGAASLAESAAAGEPELWAITRCQLRLLASVADSHIGRRHGADVAMAVRQHARRLLAAWPPDDAGARASMWPGLRACDEAWKAAGINPGTTADLVAASILIMRLTDARGYNSGRPPPDARDLRKGPETAAPGNAEWASVH